MIDLSKTIKECGIKKEKIARSLAIDPQTVSQHQKQAETKTLAKRWVIQYENLFKAHNFEVYYY